MTPPAPPITLRQITVDDLPELQSFYEASGRYFLSHGGGPPRPEQAAFTYEQALESGDRALLGIWWEYEIMVGCFDLRFDHPLPGIVWFGALILRDALPAPHDILESWSVRILEEWLHIGTEMAEVRLAVLLSDRERVRFWTDMGYQPTQQIVRQIIGGKSQRFAIYHKEIARVEVT